MNFQPIDIIKNAIKNNKLSHAYLFYGDQGVDVEKYAFETIKLLIELTGRRVDANNIDEINYFDLKIIKPDADGLIKKEVVDKTIDKLFETSLEKNAIKILYIQDIDLGNKFSLNRLLKFIEEPTNNLIIIIKTNHFTNVLSTITSRTQNIFVKRELIEEKIKIMEPVAKELSPLVANIFSNFDQLNQIDFKSFKKTYNELIDALNKAIKSKFVLKEELNKIWQKKNSDFVLEILQLFFYQLMVEINNKNQLFPNQEELINFYKQKNSNCLEIIRSIDETKKSLRHYSNFNLSKLNLLNIIEENLK